MKLKNSFYLLAATVLISGCSIFKPGCHCPKVSSIAPKAVRTAKQA